jgi:hypothetical protein
LDHSILSQEIIITGDKLHKSHTCSQKYMMEQLNTVIL